MCMLHKKKKRETEYHVFLMTINIYKYLRLHFAAQQEVSSRPVMRRGLSLCLKEAVRKLKYDSFQTTID